MDRTWKGVLLVAVAALGCDRQGGKRQPARDAHVHETAAGAVAVHDAAVHATAHDDAAPAVLADDDAHNHDGSHDGAPTDCGTDYMLPGETARLGSHSFMIIARDGPDHVIAEHRSGTPPHNYQFLLRVRLDEAELAAYEKIARASGTLPAFTTIYFDAAGEQVDRTFFCLADLPAIFGAQKRKGDGFERLFPIRASLQRDADHEGLFDIKASVSRGDAISLERDDVELVLTRYLPAYLPQDALRRAIRARADDVVPRLGHAPLRAGEAAATAAARASYMAGDGSIATAGRSCPRNAFLKGEPVAETIHTFLLVAAAGDNAVIATHYYDRAPQNFQTVVKLHLTDDELALYRRAAAGSTLPVLQTRVVDGGAATDSTFCMQDLRALVKTGAFAARATIFQGSTLDDYRLGAPVGVVDLAASDVEVLVNRRLESFMDPLAVAKDVLGAAAVGGAWSPAR